MSDFKVTGLRVGDKLNIGFSAEQFEDWQDHFQGLPKARGLHSCLLDESQTGIKAHQTDFVLR
jgi:hypothetical protein